MKASTDELRMRAKGKTSEETMKISTCSITPGHRTFATGYMLRYFLDPYGYCFTASGLHQ
jgi:hypothetical protein